jgi:hypothetical protein
MPFGIAHVKRDGRTLGREGARQRWPHATTGTGDEHHAIRQPQIHAERIAFSPRHVRRLARTSPGSVSFVYQPGWW